MHGGAGERHGLNTALQGTRVRKGKVVLGLSLGAAGTSGEGCSPHALLSPGHCSSQRHGEGAGRHWPRCLAHQLLPLGPAWAERC